METWLHTTTIPFSFRIIQKSFCWRVAAQKNSHSTPYCKTLKTLSTSPEIPHMQATVSPTGSQDGFIMRGPLHLVTKSRNSVKIDTSCFSVSLGCFQSNRTFWLLCFPGSFSTLLKSFQSNTNYFWTFSVFLEVSEHLWKAFRVILIAFAYQVFSW